MNGWFLEGTMAGVYLLHERITILLASLLAKT